MMNYLVLMCCVGFASVYGLSHDKLHKFTEKMNQAAEECISEVGATHADVDHVMTQNIPRTKAGKCLVACIHHYFGIQDDNGKIDKDAVMRMIEEYKDDDEERFEAVKKIAEKCLTVDEDDNPCETAVNLMACFIKATKEEHIADDIF